MPYYIISIMTQTESLKVGVKILAVVRKFEVTEVYRRSSLHTFERYRSAMLDFRPIFF